MSAGAAPEPLFTELSARRLGPVRTFFVRYPVVMDVLVMVIFALPALVSALAGPFLEGPPVTDSTELEVAPLQARNAVVGGLFVVVATVALFWRRRRPITVLAATTVLCVVSAAVVGTTNGMDLAVSLTLYAVAASRPNKVTWLAFGSSMVLLWAAVWVWEESLIMSETDGVEMALSTTSSRIGTIVFITLAALLAIAIGTSVRGRRQHIAELVGRANALARDRDQQAALARASERSRIAREMHDVVAHSLSVMIALADGAGAALTKSPESSRLALDELSSTGRSALADMRRVLGVLDEPSTPFEPQPDSQDLGALIDRFRAAGMTVSATGLTTQLPTDAGLQLAVYRIVQESLTNTLRHAPATARVEVSLERTAHAIEVTVTDRGPGVTPPQSTPGAGRGVIGMRERVGVYGGAVEAGPWEGGWRVHAVLPWDGGTAAEKGQEAQA